MHVLNEHGKEEIATRGHTRKEGSRENPKPVKRDFAFASTFSLSLSLYILRFSLDSSREISVLTLEISILDYSELFVYNFGCTIRLRSCDFTRYTLYSFHIHISAITLIDKQTSDVLIILIKFAIVYKFPSSILINKSNHIRIRGAIFYIFCTHMHDFDYIVLCYVQLENEKNIEKIRSN